MRVRHNPGGQDGGSPAGEATRTHARIQHVLRITCRSVNRDTFNVCSHCGAPPYRGPPVTRDPLARPVVVDIAKLQARRAAILAKMEGRSGQQRERKRADEFDAFLLAYSRGRRGWQPRRTMMYLTGPASSTRKAKGRRGYMTRRAQGWGPPGEKRVLQPADVRSNMQRAQLAQALYQSCGCL